MFSKGFTKACLEINNPGDGYIIQLTLMNVSINFSVIEDLGEKLRVKVGFMYAEKQIFGKKENAKKY